MERASLAVTGESDARARLPAIAAGALVPLLGALGAARAWGARAGAAALLLLAFEPRLIHHAEQARPYALAEMFALLAFLGLVQTLRTGAARWRVIAWSAAVLSFHAHYVFAPVLLACLAGALAGAGPPYPRRRALRDAGVALLALLPAAGHVAALATRRGELAWVKTRDLAVLGAILPGRARWFAIAGALRGAVTRRPGGRGPLAFALASMALPALAVLALLAVGTNLLDERYLALAVVAAPLASAWAIAALPRPLAAVALAVIAVSSMRSYDERYGLDAWRPEWREVAAAVRALEPGPGEPVLLESGFVEARVALDPGRLTPELRGFLASPLEDQPGHPETGRTYLVLSSDGDTGSVAGAARIVVVASPGTVDAFARRLGPGYTQREVLRTVRTPLLVVAVFLIR